MPRDMLEEAPTIATESWRDVLLRAADLIIERGHCKFVQQDQLGRLCLHGALSIAAHGKPYEFTQEASRAVCQYLRSVGEHIPHDACAAAWNNVDERTPEQVVAVLRAAATRK